MDLYIQAMLILNLPPVTLITQEFILNRSGRKILGRPQRRQHQKSLRTSTTVALAESIYYNYFATLGSVEDQRQLPKEGMDGKLQSVSLNFKS